jgi:hypothetical protein
LISLSTFTFPVNPLTEFTPVTAPVNPLNDVTALEIIPLAVITLVAVVPVANPGIATNGNIVSAMVYYLLYG